LPATGLLAGAFGYGAANRCGGPDRADRFRPDRHCRRRCPARHPL